MRDAKSSEICLTLSHPACWQQEDLNSHPLVAFPVHVARMQVAWLAEGSPFGRHCFCAELSKCLVLSSPSSP